MTLKNSVILLLITHIHHIFFQCLILFIWWKIFWKRSAVKVLIIFLELIFKYHSARFIICLTHRTLIVVNLWFIINCTSIVCLNDWVPMQVINLGNKYASVVFESIAIIEVQIDWVSCFLYIDFWIAKCSVLDWQFEIFLIIQFLLVSLVKFVWKSCACCSYHTWIKSSKFF